MSRKVIIDCDPGIDDAFALTMALFDTRLEVVAVTAVAGKVSAEQTNCNVQSIIERLDPTRYPRIGAATPADSGPGTDARHIYGDDGLGNTGFTCSRLARQHPAEKIIADELRAAPNQITILCLGPLTNIARTFQRDPSLLGLVDRLVIMGGAVNCIGNVTPTAEFNMYYDPESARSVFRAPITKTLIPLDVTDKVKFEFGLVNQLPSEASRAGNLVRSMLPHMYRVYRQQLGLERVHLHEAVALVALTNPELFEMQEMAADIETVGELTIGTTIFDRRSTFRGARNIEVATEVDVTSVTDCIFRAIAEAGRATS
jgi:inosine-uridine nucleoside N-ribohydrolase